MTESVYDFESVSHLFADHGERKFFEQCAAFVEEASDKGQQRLYILNFAHFMKSTDSILKQVPHKRGRPTLNKTNSKKKYYEYDPYAIYIMIKYIGLPKMSQKLVDFYFERTIFHPSTMLNIYNDEFIQNFFSVNSQTDIK